MVLKSMFFFFGLFYYCFADKLLSKLYTVIYALLNCRSVLKHRGVIFSSHRPALALMWSGVTVTNSSSITTSPKAFCYSYATSVFANDKNILMIKRRTRCTLYRHPVIFPNIPSGWLAELTSCADTCLLWPELFLIRWCVWSEERWKAKSFTWQISDLYADKDWSTIKLRWGSDKKATWRLQERDIMSSSSPLIQHTSRY